MEINQWVYCPNGRGFRHENGAVSKRARYFSPNSVGRITKIEGTIFSVWLIGSNETWNIAEKELQPVNVSQTGDKFAKKICNVCHCLLPVENFARNQNNMHGIVRRPSCNRCRTDIEHPKANRQKRSNAPKRAFQCPICGRRSIVGITAKIVADHDHHTGNIFICDSCNTGLGRFKNGQNHLYNAIAYLEERDKFNS